MNKLFHVLFRLVLAGLLLSPFYARAADAASLTVAVQQVGSNNAAQTVTCTLMQKGCVLPLVINAGQPTQQSVNINVVYFSGKLVINFQTPGGYFYTGNTVGKMVVYDTLWDGLLQGSAPATYTVTLFQPLAQGLMGRETASTTAHTSVANLQVTATPNP